MRHCGLHRYQLRDQKVSNSRYRGWVAQRRTVAKAIDKQHLTLAQLRSDFGGVRGWYNFIGAAMHQQHR